MVASVRASGLAKRVLGIAVLSALFSACSDGNAQVAKGAAGQPGSAGNAAVCHAERASNSTATGLTALDPSTVARAAAVIGACLPDDGVARNAGYLWAGQVSSDRLFDRYALQLECLANSACGCEATRNCLGYRAGPVESL